MFIYFHEKTKTFHLQNEKISYVMCVLKSGELAQLYYGKRIHDREDFGYLLEGAIRSHSAYPEDGSYGISPEHIKQEYPSFGYGDFRQGAIEILQKASAATDGIRVKALPVRYPQGGEKQLIYAVTRRRVPAGGLPLDVGVVVCNVGTVFAVDEAIRLGMPLIRRVTTVGGLVNNPGNYLVRIGTPVASLLDASGGMQSGVRQFIYGCPMMGQAIARTDIPVTKGCSGIVCLAEEAKEPTEGPCIRCGRCAAHCPMRLQPLMIDAHVRVDDYEGAERAGVMNCIECGICTFVCPAKRCITQACRTAKSVINTRRKQAQAKAAAEKAELEKKQAEEAAKQAAAEGKEAETV